MKNPEFAQSANLIRYAISQGIIDPAPDVVRRWQYEGIDKWTPIFRSTQTKWLQSAQNSPWLWQQQSWSLPTTRRYVQSRFPPNAPLTQPSAASPWMVEVARFPVPFGMVGILKSFEQYVSSGEVVQSTSEHWGNPYVLGTDINWYFRLSHIHLLGNPWINVSGASAIADYLPGTSYDDMSRSDDLWFPAGSSSSSNIHFPIPGGQIVRLIVIVGVAQTAVTVSAKLAGTIQSEMNQEAQQTVRTSW